jgi:methyltransferase (TIGR00027 family)
MAWLESAAKSTASGIAALRAAGALEKDPLVRNPDYLAASLLSLGLQVLTRFHPLVRLIIRRINRTLLGGYYFHIARTKHIDAVLQRCAADGIKQLVIMGAEFDTRAFRFREVLKDVKVFELDYPATQVLKKRRLSRLEKDTLDNVCYIPIDFKVQKLDVLF